MTSDLVTPADTVVGTDGSDHARRAADWAARWCTEAGSGGRVVMLRAVTEQSLSFLDPYGAWAIDAPAQRRAVLGRAEDEMRVEEDRLRSRHPDVRVTTAVVVDDPRHALAHLSERAGLLVVGSRGRGPVASMLLGSVGAHLVRRSSCPLVVVRGRDTGGASNGGTEDRVGARAGSVVAAVDRAVDSAPVLRFAYEHARRMHLPVRLVHCHPPTIGHDPLAAWWVGPEETVEDARRALSRAATDLAADYPDVTVSLEPQPGYVDDTLARLTGSAALVVVGHHRRSSIEEHLHHTTAATVIEHATGPVAVVPLSSSPADRVQRAR